jgi:DNA-binding transcriptional LysR family regulator
MSFHPEVRVVMLEPNSRDVEGMLLGGELERAVTHFAPTSPRLRALVLAREELVLVGPASHLGDAATADFVGPAAKLNGS